MKLPRDVSGDRLVKALKRLGYSITRQTGSHVRLTLHSPQTAHSTVPLLNPIPIPVGTLSSILKEVSAQLDLELAVLLDRLSF